MTAPFEPADGIDRKGTVDLFDQADVETLGEWVDGFALEQQLDEPSLKPWAGIGIPDADA